MRDRHVQVQTQVHVGRDGWLFLTGGTNRVLRQFRRSPLQWWRLRRWAGRIEARSARAGRLGITCLHVLVPEKLSVLDHLTDGLGYDPALSPARRLASRLRHHLGFVDLVAPLRAARDGVPLYRRTDTHWTCDGCLLALRALLRACAALPPPDLGERPRFPIEGVWDLGDKLPERPREAIQNWVILREARRVHAGPLLAAYEAAGREGELHVGAHVVYRNESAAADPRVVVLFGDSNAHHAPVMLTAFLAECFREVHFIWSASLDWSYVERVRPDILIVEMAERFLAHLPDDAFDVATYRAGERPEPLRPAA